MKFERFEWTNTHTHIRCGTVVLFNVSVRHQITESKTMSCNSRKSKKKEKNDRERKTNGKTVRKRKFHVKMFARCMCLGLCTCKWKKHLKCSYLFGIFLKHIALPRHTRCTYTQRLQSEWQTRDTKNERKTCEPECVSYFRSRFSTFFC